MANGKCKYCGDGVGFDHWELGFDFCPDCSEIEEERSRKKREWVEYHDEPCPEIELPPYKAEPFPQPRRKDGEEPCGECHIQPGETCDICGAFLPATSVGGSQP